jgi:membrane protease YdiL (CAAX protease family)
MLKEIFAIGNYPNLPLTNTQSFGEKVLTVLKAYGFIFLFLLAIAPLAYLADYCVTHLFHHPSIAKQGIDAFHRLIHKVGYTIAILYICLIGPILEETIFRLPLSFKRLHIAISIAVAIFLFSSPLPFVKYLSVHVGVVYMLLIRIGVSATICFVIFKLLPAEINLSPNRKKAFIILSIMMFGLMHIFNYAPLQWQMIWIYPIYVLPQLGMGVALSYVRFKNGFIWGIALHCLINSVATLLTSIPQPVAKVQHTHVYQKPAAKN